MAKRSSPKMTAARRERMSPKSFALGHKRYPIDTISRARNALARVAQHGTQSEQKRVHAAVCKKFPSIESCK